MSETLPGANYIIAFSAGVLLGMIHPPLAMVFAILWMVWVAAYNYERARNND